jgi:hypothetical protein
MPTMTSPSLTDRTRQGERIQTLKTAAIMTLLLLLAGLIAWAMWRRGKVFGHENGAAWEYQPAKAADASHPPPATHDGNAANAIPPLNTDSLPDPAAAHTPDLTGKPLRKRSPTARLPLAKPVPQQEAPAPAVPRRKRHRRGILGLGKLWHWIRRDHHKKPE